MLKATVDGNTEVIEGILRDIHNSEILILSIFIYFSIIFLYNYYMKSLFMKLGDFIDFVLGGVSMSDKINRKVELYRVEILNNDDRNDMYSKKIILEDLLVDFFNSSKRLVPVSKSRKTNIFCLWPISFKVISTGYFGISFDI